MSGAQFQLPQQLLLGMGQQGEGIFVVFADIRPDTQSGHLATGFEGRKRIGSDDIKAVIGTEWSRRFQQHGPRLMLQAGKKLMEFSTMV